MNIDTLKRIHPGWLAASIALLGTIIYLLTGRASLSLQTRELERSPQVEKVAPAGNNTLRITCKNGEQYEIVYRQGQTDFQDLVYDKCGRE